MKRILILSDIHGAVAKAKKLANLKRDLTIVAGDISSCGSIEEARAVLGELARHSPVVWIPGNCDSPELPSIEIEGTRCIHMRLYNHYGLALAGVGGSIHTPFGTPFEYSEEEFRAMLSKLEEVITGNSSDSLILVSHTPPYMSGLDRVRGGAYVGSLSLREFVARVKPRLLVTGHIHEAWGVASVEGVLTVNPGPLEAGRYAVADIEPDKDIVRIRLAKLPETGD
ncbi:hypothetical protein Pyrde_0133 [Pyrodictium delaneyi]|nr:metallophosphoesterase [Pyrodictium delaneyi]ALL00183.1 hypothetical protein Pyrde_0133 [Pyrodictium delaneyi]